MKIMLNYVSIISSAALPSSLESHVIVDSPTVVIWLRQPDNDVGESQYVAIGRGIQNYTCATASSVPVALGAVATLFDATSLAYSNEAIDRKSVV